MFKCNSRKYVYARPEMILNDFHKSVIHSSFLGFQRSRLFVVSEILIAAFLFLIIVFFSIFLKSSPWLVISAYFCRATFLFPQSPLRSLIHCHIRGPILHFTILFFVYNGIKFPKLLHTSKTVFNCPLLVVFPPSIHILYCYFFSHENSETDVL